MQDKQVKAKTSSLNNLQLFSELRQAPRLRSYPDPFIERLSALGQALQVPIGFEILTEGQASDHVFLLLRGSVRLQSKNKIFFHLHQCGELFGEGAFLMKEPGRETAIASTPTELLRLPVAGLAKLQQDPRFREMLLRLIANSQQDKFQRLLRSPTGGEIPQNPQNFTSSLPSPAQEKAVSPYPNSSYGEISYEDLSPSPLPISKMSLATQEDFYTELPLSKESPHPVNHPSAPQLSTLLPLLQKGTVFEGKRTTPLNTWSPETSELWGWLAQMQHDLLAPLENAQGLAHKLSVTQLNSWQRALVLEIQSAQQKIQQHLVDLFSLSAIENKEAIFHQHSFSLERCLSDTFATLQEQAQARGIFLQYYYAPGMELQRKGDPAQLSKLLRVLLETSLHWTPQGEVVLWVEPLPQAPDWLRFSLRDTSPGLSAEQNENIFKQYHPPNKPPATGLRLILAKRLIQAMGGQLSFESHPQQGAHFLLNLCLPAHHDLRRPSMHTSARSTGADIASTSLRSSAELDIIPPPDHLRPLKQARTLLVDSSQENSALTGFYLQALELSPDLVRDGEKALERSAQKTYDLILIGTPLPDMEPWELGAKLRTQHDAQHRKNPLQLISLLHHEPTPTQQKQLQQHHDAWLVRPFPKQMLVQILQKLWKGRQTMASQDTSPPSPSKANLTAQFDALLQRYLTNLNQRIERLREALSEGDFEEIRHIGHKLKGSGSSYGFDQITEIGRQMEIAGESNDTDASERLINELQTTLQDIQTQGPAGIR